ncbi:hypothetical protein TNCT_537081 [Trichonephila clavata]|uniref:C2H2-type domain-containing protein n=1 Tax=Trichonephila clavata TaxID=2740835 RepID=A0A8X6G9H0_TRICU|nr:hypothetical protein TNCT_537081 [Trichonephila clavata]
MKKRNSTEAVSYRCDASDITFRSSTQLLHHSYGHLDDRSQRCSHCQKGSAKAFFLERHLKERQCFCFNCMRAFRGKMCPLLFSDYQTLLMCEKCSDGSFPIDYVTLTGCSSLGKKMAKKVLS